MVKYVAANISKWFQMCDRPVTHRVKSDEIGGKYKRMTRTRRPQSNTSPVRSLRANIFCGS
jgi:hypothetical protein